MHIGFSFPSHTSEGFDTMVKDQFGYWAEHLLRQMDFVRNSQLAGVAFGDVLEKVYGSSYWFLYQYHWGGFTNDEGRYMELIRALQKELSVMETRVSLATDRLNKLQAPATTEVAGKSDSWESL